MKNKSIPEARNPMQDANVHSFLLKKKPETKSKMVRRTYEITRQCDKKIKDLAYESQCPEYKIIQPILDAYFEKGG